MRWSVTTGSLAFKRWLRFCLISVVCLNLHSVGNASDQTPLPSVMSINLCADQLVLLLADHSQIKALSTLSQDAAGSYFHELAEAYPQVDVSAEHILPYAPDVVLTGPYTSRYTLSLLSELGLRVESLEIATSIEEMLANVIRVGNILQRESAAESVVQDVRDRLAHLEERVAQLDALRLASGADAPKAAVYDANGYTVGHQSLRGEAMRLAGWHNVAQDRNIESYGVLALEDLIRLRPDALIESPYSEDTYSRGQALTRHPALREAGLNPLTISLPSNETICAGPWSVGTIENLVDARSLRHAN